MVSIERTAYPRFYNQPSERELQAYYAITDIERNFVLHTANGNSGRLTLLVMLKTRQQLGYFPNLTDIPKVLTTYLTQIFKLPKDTTLNEVEQFKKTWVRYRLAIRSFLNCCLYADTGAELVKKVMITAASTMSDPADLINVAVQELIKNNIELPAFSTLDRLAGHCRQKIHNEIFSRTGDGVA
ncbi:hypothetical protein VCRA2120E57_1510001 [Vibrio crassostreae]|nr:hypothetical protein VCRA2120E57_1510001 [Vibrio crassostreae]